MLYKAVPESVATLLRDIHHLSLPAHTFYSYQVKKSLVYFDDAVNSLGDVTMVKKGQKVRLEREGWKEIEKYFKGIIFSQ